MFHIGRSGSSVLCGMLNQRRDVFWDGELYRRALEDWRMRGWTPTGGPLPVDPIAYLRRRMILAGRRYYGIEVKGVHLRQLAMAPPDFVRTLRQERFSHVIVLRRRNILRVLVSYAVAREHQRFHGDADGVPVLRPVRLAVQPQERDGARLSLVERIALHDGDLAEITDLTRDVNLLKLFYEDDIEPDPMIGYRRVCDHLGLSPCSVTVELGRLNPFPLPQLLRNYGEVEAALAGTSYEWMLERGQSRR